MSTQYTIPLQSGGAFIVGRTTGGGVLISGPRAAGLTQIEACELSYAIAASTMMKPAPAPPASLERQQARGAPAPSGRA